MRYIRRRAIKKLSKRYNGEFGSLRLRLDKRRKKRKGQDAWIAADLSVPNKTVKDRCEELKMRGILERKYIPVADILSADIGFELGEGYTMGVYFGRGVMYMKEAGEAIG